MARIDYADGAMLRVVVALACLGGCAASFRGVVFADRNGDGIRQSNEHGVGGVVVAIDRGSFVTTDANGSYTIDAVAPGEILWVRTPSGFRPGPVWRPIPSNDTQPIDLPLTPLSTAELASPLTFVVAADSHTTASATDPWDGGDLLDAIDQATSLPDPPRFFTIVGDITQGGTGAEIDRVQGVIAELGVPWIPVPGNHDWLDGGAAYRTRFGPDNYSFDVGEVHVIVWDTNLADDDQVAFFTADLAQVEHGTTVVALGHASPNDVVAEQIAALGVTHMFTGHWHANRRIERTGLVEWATQTFVMGGIDQSPSGYRVVTFDHGVPTIVHRERMIAPHLGATMPHADSCAPATGFSILASAALDATAPAVTARIDCGPEIPLTAAGGWVFRGDAPALAAGTHSLDLHAIGQHGRELATQVAFDVCAAPASPTLAAAWPQVGGGPTHTGASPTPIATPLQVAWTTAVGGSLALGTPIVVGTTVVVAQVDRGAGNAGGLVALDLATGAIRWRATTAFPITAAPAIDGDTVVATLGNGEIRAFALADGAPRWSFDLAAGLSSHETAQWAPPTIAAGHVYAGVQARFAALDVATGAALWIADRQTKNPWLGSLGAPGIDGDTVVASFSRADGTSAWHADTGATSWQVIASSTSAVNAAPVIANGIAYIASASGDVSALDLATGAARWTRRITTDGFDWGYSITAAPALAGGTLFVPTQWGALVALDAATGTERWRVTTPGGPLETAHYRSAQPGFAASPIVAGDLVWIGRPDGRLVALATADGHEVWSTSLGAPILSAPAPAGDWLIVSTYDGTVHALAPARAEIPGPVMACPPLAPTTPPAPEMTGGGCCGVGGDPAGALALVLVQLLAGARRHARRAR